MFKTIIFSLKINENQKLSLDRISIRNIKITKFIL